MHRSRLIIPGLFALSACVGEIGAPASPPMTMDPTGEPDAGGVLDGGGEADAMPEPDPWTVVPAALPALASTATCTARDPGERVLAVSAEGHLWLGTSTVSTTSVASTFIRVLDGWSPGAQSRDSLPFANIASVQAWTATTASMIADGALWFIEDGDRLSISLPAVLADDATLCGDPSRRAFVLSGDALYQRVGPEWFLWSGIDRALMGDGALLSRDGECAGSADRVWIVSSEVAFWSLTPASISNPALLTGGSHPALRGDDLLALFGGHLFVGPEPWREWAFEQGSARALAAAGSYAWIVAGDRLLRFDGTAFFDVAAANEIVALHPHASGGLWYETASSICHVAPDPMLRVHGLRNGEERADSDFVIRAEATREDMSLVATVDGVELAASGVEADGAFVFTGALGVGWHNVQLSAPNGVAVRSLSVKKLPSIERSFAADIQPIYAASCAGSACHSPNSTAGAPDFSRYEVWLQRAVKIQERIVQKQDMPPLASRGPDWSEDQVAIINEWLNGGMKP